MVVSECGLVAEPMGFLEFGWGVRERGGEGDPSVGLRDWESGAGFPTPHVESTGKQHDSPELEAAR